MSQSLKDRVQDVLEQVRPMLQRDGGDVVLIDVTEKGVVSIELQGACVGCPFSTMTLKHGIEAALKREIPEVTEVVSL